jgi:nicotinate-nucleotide adenylyltransferase
MKQRRIGIYSGTFDPVHAGHISFALQAMRLAELDKLYFLPERRPRGKQGVEHFGHRVAMLKRALRPYPRFDVMELVDVNFSVERTLPKLQQLFAGDQLIFLQGSDVIKHLFEWPNAEALVTTAELIVSVRAGDTVPEIQQLIDSWPVRPKEVTVFESYAADVSSRLVRNGLRERQNPPGLLESVARYSNRHWLYVSLS